jgi:hypothetical protein
MFTIFFFFVALTGVFYSLGFDRLWRLVAIIQIIVLAGLCAYRYLSALRCPRCNTSLGFDSVRDFWWSFPKNIDRCPYCDLDFDRDLDTIQTI